MQRIKIPWYRRPISDGNPVEAVTRKHVLHAKSTDQITERSISNSLTKSGLRRESISASNREKRSFSKELIRPFVETYRLYDITACVHVYINRSYRHESGIRNSTPSSIFPNIYISKVSKIFFGSNTARSNLHSISLILCNQFI